LAIFHWHDGGAADPNSSDDSGPEFVLRHTCHSASEARSAAVDATPRCGAWFGRQRACIAAGVETGPDRWALGVNGPLQRCPAAEPRLESPHGLAPRWWFRQPSRASDRQSGLGVAWCSRASCEDTVSRSCAARVSLTDSIVMHNVEAAIATLQGLKSLGLSTSSVYDYRHRLLEPLSYLQEHAESTPSRSTVAFVLENRRPARLEYAGPVPRPAIISLGQQPASQGAPRLGDRLSTFTALPKRNNLRPGVRGSPPKAGAGAARTRLTRGCW